jgi:hypothetical protein
MANDIRSGFLKELTRRYGSPRKLGGSQSLFEILGGAARVYVRYSRVHSGHKTFYGLRSEDLQQLEGHPAVICFLWDDQPEPLVLPFLDYEDVFSSTSPAGDGQYKAQVYLEDKGVELYVARGGRFNVERHLGWDDLDALAHSVQIERTPDLSHPQVQTLLGARGASKDYDVWVPPNDRSRLDWSMTPRFVCRDDLPYGYQPVRTILQEIDVIWIKRGSGELKALFEVEHSTPVYSALLRFNDIFLTDRNLHARFSVAANEARRELFVRQLNRPTFRESGLSELCSFLQYSDVFLWHHRVVAG